MCFAIKAGREPLLFGSFGVCFLATMISGHDFRPLNYQIFEATKGSVNQNLIISAKEKVYLFGIYFPVLACLVGGALIGGVALILGLILYSPLASQDQSLFQEKAVNSSDIVKTMVKENKSYLELPWDRIKSFSANHDTEPDIGNRYSYYNPPLYMIKCQGNFIEIRRKPFAGHEEQIFDYIRTRNIKFILEDNPLQ